METLYRFGIKLPVLEKLVATSHKPILVLEAYKGIQESAKSWRAISDEVANMRNIIAFKEEEPWNKYNIGIKLLVLEKLVATSHKPILVLEAYKGIQESAKSWRAISDEVANMRNIIASKEEEPWNKYNIEEVEAS